MSKAVEILRNSCTGCEDSDDRCSDWAAVGECEKNPSQNFFKFYLKVIRATIMRKTRCSYETRKLKAFCKYQLF